MITMKNVLIAISILVIIGSTAYATTTAQTPDPTHAQIILPGRDSSSDAQQYEDSVRRQTEERDNTDD